MNRGNNKKKYKMKLLRSFILFVCVCLFSVFAIPENSFAGKFTQTFLIRYGGTSLNSGDEVMMANFDLIAVGRNKYDDIGNTWSKIKAINPSTEIYLYQALFPKDNCDDKPIIYLNNLGRWNISRGHSMGNLNTDNSDLFLLNSDSDRIYDSGNNDPNRWILDMGTSGYQNYWLEATVNDLVNQPWTADGVFIDNCVVGRNNMSSMPSKYPTDDAWASAMHEFLNAITIGLNNQNKKTWCNRTRVGISDWYFNQWIALDNTANPPDIIFEEGVFAVLWGEGDVQFCSEDKWKRQIDIMSQIHNSKVTYLSHSDLDMGQSGTDNYGKPVTFWDILWYCMGSYQIGKNTVDNNSYFGFSESYNKVTWYDEFDHINLGNAIGQYKVTNYAGNNIYWREFEKGYVFVNPTKYDVSSISLPETCKQLTHWNFKNNPDTLPKINTISLKAHRAVMLLKDTYDDELISAPASFRITDIK